MVQLIREAQAVAKGLVLEEGQDVPPAVRRKEILKRIREWERFEDNCKMLRELEREKRKLKKQLEDRRRHHSSGSRSRRPRNNEECVHDLRKTKSLATQLSPT